MTIHQLSILVLIIQFGRIHINRLKAQNTLKATGLVKVSAKLNII